MKHISAIKKLIVILFWISLWGLAAYQIDKPLLVPSPITVISRIVDLICITDFWMLTALSLIRITIGILAAILLGVLLGALTATSGFLNDLLAPIQTITKVTPVASFILLVLIWLDRDIVPIVISALMVLPVVWNNVAAGLQNIDKGLLEMADVYQLGFRTKIKRMILPSIMPYFLSAIRTSIGIGWKAGIAAEVLTVPVLSIGKMIADSKMYMETVDLFAWTIVVILISLLIETLLIAFIKKYGAKYFNKVGGYD